MLKMANTSGKMIRAITSILLARDLNFSDNQNEGLKRELFRCSGPLMVEDT